MSQILIQCLDKKNVHPPISTEIGFLMSGEKKLHFSQNYSKAQVIDFLANAVSRNPRDLRLHTQRLFQHLEYKDQSVYGVLLDLFIALGSQGLSVKKRMLNLAKPFLTPEQVQIFRKTKGLIFPDSVVPPSTYSILSLGYTGTSKLIRNITKENTLAQQRSQSTKPLRTAVAYIRKGHIESAQKLLEKAILEGNMLKQTHQKLLDIYIFTKNAKACQQIQQQINPKLPPSMLALWQSSLDSIKISKS